MITHVVEKYLVSYIYLFCKTLVHEKIDEGEKGRETTPRSEVRERGKVKGNKVKEEVRRVSVVPRKTSC